MFGVCKYHGCGNDFLILPKDEADPAGQKELVRALCRRHTGIGADGAILWGHDPLRMDFLNRDGSAAPMCGNGLRCFALFCLDEGLAEGEELTIQTGAGPRKVQVLNRDPFLARTELGKADFSPEAINANSAHPLLDLSLPVGGRRILLDCFFLSTAHAVWLVPDPFDPVLQRMAEVISRHSLFRDGINVNLVQVIDRSTLRLCTYERGAGLTLACGTGAAAAALAACRRGLCENKVQLLLPGGRLTAEISPDDTVWLTGPAQRVIKGEYALPREEDAS